MIRWSERYDRPAIEDSALPPPPPEPIEDEEPTFGIAFWVGTVIGWIAIGYGVWLLVDDPEAQWVHTLSLAAIGLIAHDVVWLGVSISVGWVLARLLRRRTVPHWLRWGTWTTAIVTAIWFPLWRGYGDRIGNETILVRDYTWSIVVLLIVIWSTAIFSAVFVAVRARRRRPVR